MPLGKLNNEADLDRHIERKLLNGTGLLTMQGVRGLGDKFGEIEGTAGTHRGLVTSLPSDPNVGTRCTYKADDANGIFWELVYDGVGLYPWKRIGGPPLFAEVATGESRGASSYGDLTTGGPAITLPLAGDYDVEVGAHAWGNGTAGFAHMSYAIGATGASDADSYETWSGAATGSHVNTGSFARRKTGLSAVTLTAKYRNLAGSSSSWKKRWMRALPVRVG